MQRTSSLLTLFTCLSMSMFVATPANGDDWPNWRGSNGSGVSKESGWATTGKASPKWSKNLGLGYASFSVSKGRLVSNGFNEDEGHDTVFCLDAESGSTLWTHDIASKKHSQAHGGGTLSTPTIDGERVYVLQREGKLLCLNIADGEVAWQKDLMATMDIKAPTWMFASSPLVQGNRLYVNVGRTIAFNKSTGDVIWKSTNTGHAYSTPQPISLGDHDGLVVFNGGGVGIIDTKDGKVLATYPWKTSYDINASTPVVMGDRIFISSGYNHGCAMLKFNGESLEPVWESKVMKNKMSGCVLWEGHLYGFDETTLKCIDLAGNEKWAQRGLGMGALMIADGKLIVSSAKGELVIADATPGGFEELSRQRVLQGGVYWTMPVLANGLIYCRNSIGDVVCMDHRSSDG